MRLLPLITLLGLAACDGAGPGFSGLAPVERQVESSRFVMRQRGDVIEAVRTTPEFMPRFHIIAQRAGVAAWQQTGCIPRWVIGDPAMMWVGLACDGREPPRLPPRRGSATCEVHNGGQGMLTVTCGG